MKSKKPIVMPKSDDEEYQKFLREVSKLAKEINRLKKTKKSFTRVGSAKTDTGIN